MTGPELIALGHAAIAKAHELILLGGMLGLLSIVAGLISRRVGAPMLLVFLALGMLAAEGDEEVALVAVDGAVGEKLLAEQGDLVVVDDAVGEDALLQVLQLGHA